MNINLLNNKNFELSAELAPDIEASLIVQYDKFNLEETFEKLNKIKSKCSKEIQNGIDEFIDKKTRALEQVKIMLDSGYVLFPVLEPEEQFLHPQVLTSFNEFINIGSNLRYILIKLGEKSQNNTRGYGSLLKNSKNELVNVSVSKEIMPELSVAKNPLFNTDIHVAHKFKRFDIIKVPYLYAFCVVVDKDDVEGDYPNPVGQGHYITNLLVCRPSTGWDFDKPYYFEHITSVYTIADPFYKKIEYDEAPEHIKKLVDHLKNNFYQRKGCVE